MKNGILRKISSNKNAIRTEGDIEGTFPIFPLVGHSFVLWAEPIDKNADFREITTSKITDVTIEGSLYTFVTLNSIYELECIGTDL